MTDAWILAIDPGNARGKGAGVALWSPFQSFIFSTVVCPAAPGDVAAFLETFAPRPWSGVRRDAEGRPVRAAVDLPIHVFIEDQYPGPKTAYKSLRTLIRRAWTWGAILEGVYGCAPVAFVNPSSWQSKVLRGAPGANTKERSIFVAERALGRKVQSDDEADAVCLLLYAQQKLRTQGEGG